MKMNKLKRMLVVGLACGLLSLDLFSTELIVSATETVDSTSVEDDGNLAPEEKQQKEFEEKLKKAYELPVQTNELSGWPQAVGTYGDAAIVMDADSGAILYAKNIDKQEYPASITKVLTALMVFENDAMDLEVVISAESMECIRNGYASIGLDEGNVISMEQAMHAMLMASSNEAAYAIGEAVAKSQGEDYAWFLEQMNQRCKELGGVNSNFLNANGMFDENHYSCALDMALISREIFKYPKFFEICQTPQYTIPASATTEEHVFQQKHHMLLDYEKEYYEYAIGGKTGYTTEAQNTLITMADNDGRKLICVVLYEYPGYVYTDTQALLDYGFADFENVGLSGETSLAKLDDFPENAYVTVPEGITLDDLEQDIIVNEESGNTIVKYYYENMQVASYDVGKQDIPREELEMKVTPVAEEEKSGTDLGKMLKTAGVVAGVLVLIFICLVAYARVKRKQRRKARMRRRREACRRAEMTARQVRAAERRVSPREFDRPSRYDAQYMSNTRRPVNRNNQDVYRKAPGNQNALRDRRPKNRRFD